MPAFSIKTLTRDSFIVEFDGADYKVDGERGGDGTWEIFPDMVYTVAADGTRELVDDARLRNAVVAALREHWHEYDYPWTLA